MSTLKKFVSIAAAAGLTLTGLAAVTIPAAANAPATEDFSTQEFQPPVLPTLMPATSSVDRFASADVPRSPDYFSWGQLTIGPSGEPMFPTDAVYDPDTSSLVATGGVIRFDGTVLDDLPFITSPSTADIENFGRLARYASGASKIISVEHPELTITTASGSATLVNTFTPAEEAFLISAMYVSADASRIVFGHGSVFVDGNPAAQDTPLYLVSGASAEVISGSPSGEWIQLEAATSGGTERLWAATKQGGIYSSTDGGDNWSTLATAPASFANGLRAVSFGDSGKFVAVTLEGEPYASTDLGATWTRLRDTANYGGNFHHAVASADGTHLAAFSNLGILLSKNSGATWNYVAVTLGETQSAVFTGTGASTTLTYFRAAVNFQDYAYIYHWDLSTMNWDGSTFGDGPEPTWGATIWSSFAEYVPNHMWLDYVDDDEGFKFTACDSGLTEACSISELTAVERDGDPLNDRMPARVSGRIYLDPCAADAPATDLCIKTVKVGTTDGEPAPAVLQPERPEGGFSWTAAESGVLNLPDTGQPSVWRSSTQHAGGTGDYTASVVATFEWTQADGLIITDYAATLVPVKLLKVQETGASDDFFDYRRIDAQVNTSGFGWSNPFEGCAWTDAVRQGETTTWDTICAEKHAYLPNTVVEVAVQLPKTISGWYKGRVISPALSSVSISDTTNLVTVQGEPSYKVPQLDNVQQSLADTAPDYYDLAVSLLGNGGVLLEDSDASTVQYISGLKEQAGDKSNFENSVWQFSTLALPDDACYAERPAGTIVGMVSTDSMSYSGEPPVFEGGQLKYSVAGMHKYSDNSVVSGNYDLLLESTYGRCIYELGTATLNPSVSVFETDDPTDVREGVTIGFEEADGWMNFNVRGITYSNPTIAIDFGAEQQSGGNPGGVVATPVVAPTSPVNPTNPLPAGATNAVIIGGQAVAVDVKTDASAKTLELGGAGWSLKLESAQDGQAFTDDGELIVPQSGPTNLSGSGFKAASKVAALLIPLNQQAIAFAGGPGNFATLSTATVLGELTVASDGSFTGTVSTAGVTPGDYALQINGLGPDDKLRSISIATVVPQPEFKAWTKRISETEAKVYARNPIGAGKVQFFVNGREVAWVRAENSSDRKLRRAANGVDYLVRTITLEPGKNRIEIKVDGVRLRLVTYTG